MKIIKNTSLYETKKLQSLFCLIHSQLAKYEGRLPQWKSLKIQVMDKVKGRHASGCAYRGKVYGNQPDMWLSLNKETSLEVIAQLFAHELMHSYGYNHSQYRTDPLEPHHIDEIKRKFDKNDLLSPKAFHVPQKGISYKQKCKDLMKQFEWLVIERHNIEHLREIEVYDDRDTCECYSMREFKDYQCTCDEVFDMRMNWRADNMNWCKAYENALLLILENDR